VFFTDGSGGDIHSEELTKNYPNKGRKDVGVKDAGNVAEFVIRLYGALLATQAVLVFAIRNEEGRVKRVALKGYFGCFLASFTALCWEHLKV